MLNRISFIGIVCFLLPLIAAAQTLERSLDEQSWKFRKVGDASWYAATVPGTVHTDLFKNKLIPDPFTGAREQQLQWIEKEDWEYKTIVKISKKELLKEHIELQCEGLDTYADVFLNGSLILSADNMFRSWNVEVKPFLREGKNELKVLFRSAVKEGKAEAAKLSYTLPGDEKVFTRKAQYQYGWDWGPRYVTCGIWKSIKLVSWQDARILDVQCIQHSLSDSIAELEFICEIRSDIDNSAYIDITYSHTLDISGQRTRKIKLTKGIGSYSIFYTVKQPQRWWTNDLGFPVTYGFTIDLSYDSRFLDSKRTTIGLRTLELVREKDAAGTSFYFKLNGIPVFIKGANYIPPDNFLPRVQAGAYEKIVLDAKEANMNMLRVWGGGVYGENEFYTACDKNGILVWQDLMFACAMYPGDEHFTKNVAEEVEQQVKRLRNHPSLALWCGNNEIDEGWKNWGWQQQYHYSQKDSSKIADDYTLLFNNLIKDMFRIYDPERAYWPSSPSIGWGHKESLEEGDSHYWGVWWGMEPFEVYKQKTGRFMSEYGFQGMPGMSAFEKMGLYASSGAFDSLTFRAHQKHPTGYETIRTYMERDYKVPADFENYVYVSQLLQARGMKTAIEAHRRAKPYCMGTMYWQLNDCWPATSWSSSDYYGNWKALQYEAKRDFRDIMISVNEKEDSCEVSIISDRLKNIKAELAVELFDLDGNLLWFSYLPVDVNANSSKVYFKFDKNISDHFNKNNVVLRSSLTTIDSYLSDVRDMHYFAKPKDLSLKRPLIAISKPICEQVQCISLSSDVLMKDVYIRIKGESVHLSDNFFDLLPGEEKTIYLPKNVHIRKLQKKIIIKSLIDTY
jgi:beta-mannosidase